MDEILYCEYKDGHAECTAPDTKCEHWQGTFCDCDLETSIKLNAVVAQW